MTDSSIHSICAVVVTYHPDLLALRALLDALVAQVGAVVVVDNSGMGGTTVPEDIPGASIVLHQGKNIGLASAQNVGITWARDRGFEFVLVLDQDSVPAAGMVAVLLDATIRLRRTRKVAAVGPRFHDLHENRDAPFVRLGFFLNKKLFCVSPDQTIRCDFLISSGALIPLEAIDQVGMMCDGLFIDNVDLEWGFRACALGYELHGICAAQMDHRLGDLRRNVLPGLDGVVVHGPVRLYYMMRNRVLLYQMPHTPKVWITQDVPRIIAKLFLFGVLIGPRLRNLRYMLHGLWDGARGRVGACPIPSP